MALSYTGKKRIRKSFGKIPEAGSMPNLIEVQKSSYDQFLQKDAHSYERIEEGLQAVFKSVFPIRDFSDRAVLEYVSYKFEEPKFDVEECQQRDMTYAAPLKVKLRLIVFETDEETGAKSVKDIKEQDVYLGDIPLMTDKEHVRRERHRARDRVSDASFAGRSSITTRARRTLPASCCSPRA
ncbi:MAG: hypothetical protein R3C27_13565 [Hyphomonadaceae bacterium]